MELIVFTGIQAAGRSEYYQQYFYGKHIRLNLDAEDEKPRKHHAGIIHCLQTLCQNRTEKKHLLHAASIYVSNFQADARKQQVYRSGI